MPNAACRLSCPIFHLPRRFPLFISILAFPFCLWHIAGIFDCCRSFLFFYCFVSIYLPIYLMYYNVCYVHEMVETRDFVTEFITKNVCLNVLVYVV